MSFKSIFVFLQCEKSTKAQPSLGNPEECKPQYRKYSLRSQKDQPSVPVNDFRDRPELARVIPPVGFSDKKVSETSSCLMEILPNYDDETPVSCRRKRKLVYQEEEDHSVELKSGDTTSNQIGGHYNGESVADEMPLYDAPLAIIRPGFFLSLHLILKVFLNKTLLQSFVYKLYHFANRRPCLTLE